MEKRNVVLVMVSMLTLAQMAHGAPSEKDKVLMGLVSNHTRTFGANDLFKERINFDYWYQTMQGVQAFIHQNARDDNKLMSEMNTILRANDELINSIKIGYNALFASGGRMQPALASDLLTKFKGIESHMKKTESSLKSATYFYQSKKDAREILVALAGFVGASAQAAFNGLNRKMK